MPFDLVLLDDLKGIAERGKELGCSNYVIAKDFSSVKEVEELRKKIAAFFPESKAKFLVCKIVSGNLEREASQYRGKVDFVAALPRDIQGMNLAVNSKSIDFILNPFSGGELLLDTASANVCAQKEKPVAFLFSDFLESRGRSGALLAKNAIMSSSFLRKKGVGVMVFSGATSHSGMRSPEDLGFFLGLFGFPAVEGKKAILFGEKFFGNESQWVGGKK